MTLVFARRAVMPERCQTCPMRDQGPCAWFDSDLGCEIAARSHNASFAQGAPILRQGDPANRVGIIISGLVKIVLNDEEGGEHLIQLLHAGEMIGDPWATESVLSYEAATEVDLCWLPRATLAWAIQQNPAGYRGQLDVAQRQLREQQFAQVALRGRNSLQRVAHWLLLQLPAPAGAGPCRMRVLLTRRDLASLLEMTVETLCRVLHQMEDQGAIRLLSPDLIEIRDRSRLGRLGRGQADRFMETLLGAGWEWGARPTEADQVEHLPPAIAAMQDEYQAAAVGPKK